jgi:disulfide bond formation protein DsbB
MERPASPSLAITPRPVAAASALVLVIATATILAALAFEHLGGYAPCPLCLQQRYAYYLAVPASAVAMLLARGHAVSTARILLILVALAFLANTIAGIYHSGIEWTWWAGPGECAGAFELQWSEGGIVDTPVIRCDEAPWRFLGLSFAGWNAVISAFLTAVAAYGAARRQQPHANFKRA